MKIQLAQSILSVFLLTSSTVEAFTPGSFSSTNLSTQRSSINSRNSPLRMSTSQDEVSKLREAAAKARNDAARLAKELGKDDEAVAAVSQTSSGAATVTAASEVSPEKLQASLEDINFSGSANDQVSALDKLRGEGVVSLYKSATVEAGSGDLRSFPVSLQMLENRSGLTSKTLGIGAEEVSLDDFKYATLWVTGGCSVAGVAALAFLPENVGATICYAVALIPILFLGVGSTAPAAIANVIASIKGGDDSGISKAQRVCRHEAAHFLCGYLCGLPIADYTTTDENIPRVEFHDTSDGPASAKRELEEDEVNALAVIAMSGAVAEAMEFGSALGTTSDLISLEGVFRRSKSFLGAEKQQDLTRWGALTAYRLLTQNKNKLDKLVQAFEAKRSVSECVQVIEQLE